MKKLVTLMILSALSTPVISCGGDSPESRQKIKDLEARVAELGNKAEVLGTELDIYRARTEQDLADQLKPLRKEVSELTDKVDTLQTAVIQSIRVAPLPAQEPAAKAERPTVEIGKVGWIPGEFSSAFSFEITNRSSIPITDKDYSSIDCAFYDANGAIVAAHRKYFEPLDFGRTKIITLNIAGDKAARIAFYKLFAGDGQTQMPEVGGSIPIPAPPTPPASPATLPAPPK